MIDKELTEEQRRIKAAQAVLKRKGLDFGDRLRTEDDVVRYQSVLALWQNEAFLTNLEETVHAELAPDPGGIRRFLADFEAQIEDLDARWVLARWRQDSGQPVGNATSLMKEYQEIYTGDLLRELQTMRGISDVDPVIQRRLNLWQDIVRRTLIGPELEPQRMTLRQAFATYSFHLGGRQYSASEISGKILREERDRNLRYEAWSNLADLSQQVEPMMQELLTRDNVLWQDRGFPNAITPRLQMIGVSEAVVRQIITSCETASRSAAQKLISEYGDFLGHEIAQWDWRFAAGQMTRSYEQSFENVDTITCAKQTYEKLGIVIDQLPIHITQSVSIYGAPRYYVRIPHDTIVSYGPLSGVRKLLVLLRALGKACCFAHIDEALPYPFRRYAPKVLAEGLGTLAGWVLWEPDWMEEFTDLTGDQIDIFIQRMKNYELFKTRHYAGLALFELDAYAALAEDPEADLKGLYARHMEHFLLLPNDGHSVWASEPQFVEPFPYLIQYLLAMAVAANLMDDFQQRGVSLLSPHFGELLRSDLVRLGNASSWLERLEHMTSRRLTPVPMSWLA